MTLPHRPVGIIHSSSSVTSLHKFYKMRRSRSQILEFLSIFILIFFIVHTSTIYGVNFDQRHRSIATEYITETARLQLTLKGTPNALPTNREKIFLEHVLFGYLNRALTPLSLQIQLVEIDDSRTRVTDGSSSFTVISHTSDTGRRKGKMVDYQEEIEEDNSSDEEAGRELVSPGEACTLANKLFVEVEVSGRDYTMLQGQFKYRVKQAINSGNLRQRQLIELLVAPVEAEEYFREVCSIMAVIIPHGATSRNHVSDEPDRQDPAELFERNKDDTSENSDKSSSPAENEKNNTSSKNKESKPRRPMNAKAIQFRTISGSIFLSLCITAVLSNVIRVLGRQREIRKKRMAKAKQAYEVPKQAELKRKSSEKFVGMLDNGAVPTR